MFPSTRTSPLDLRSPSMEVPVPIRLMEALVVSGFLLLFIVSGVLSGLLLNIFFGFFICATYNLYCFGATAYSYDKIQQRFLIRKKYFYRLPCKDNFFREKKKFLRRAKSGLRNNSGRRMQDIFLCPFL